MGKLYFYTIFHANLSFSCIPTDQYPVILDKCYWPVVDLISKGYKLGIEFSASTLETINSIDPHFVETIRELWMDGKCDVIGSSMTQSIFPLIPVDVNRVNLREGRKVYRNLLGEFPEIGFINEQTYSKAIPELFREIGYRALIMDWDNAAEYNDFPPDLRYKPALVKGTNGAVIPIIWNSSLNSYKFQRCIYDRLSIDDFLTSVMSHQHDEHDRALALYGTDWEIFDYRPGIQEIISGEINKIEKLLKKLTSRNNAQLINPSEVLGLLAPETEIEIESPECPIPCKNRDDYNVVRWAVSGRDNVHLNSQCYASYNKLKELEFFNGLAGNNNDLWSGLNEMWGSDLRTKTTEEKHYNGKMKLGQLSHKIDERLSAVYSHFTPQYDFILINPFAHDWNGEAVEITLSFEKGVKRGRIGVEIDGQLVVSQCEHRQLYRDGSIRQVKMTVCPFIEAGYAAQGRIVELGQEVEYKHHQYTGDRINIETDSVILTMSAKTGADIRELIYPGISSKSLAGYLPPVYYDHIGHSSDYYTGGIQLCDFFGKLYNDTVQTRIVVPDNPAVFPVRLPVSAEMDMGSGKVWKTFYVYRNKPRVDVLYRFYFADLTPIFFRLGITTLNPEAFDVNTLRFSTINGGKDIECFNPNGKIINHHHSVGAFTSARTCLGATEGWVDISDKDKGIAICTDKSLLYSVPMIEYQEIKKSYLMRVYNSISESDETGRIHWRGHMTARISYVGHANSADTVRNQLCNTVNSLICIPRDDAQKTSGTMRSAEQVLRVLNTEHTDCAV
ncbi:MAG: hypothetical protein AB1454_00700 [Candidatus Auribacterota bacterium]